MAHTALFCLLQANLYYYASTLHLYPSCTADDLLGKEEASGWTIYYKSSRKLCIRLFHHKINMGLI